MIARAPAKGPDSWLPDITERPGPRYRAIVDALAEAIRAGALRPGDRLPPQRELVWRLGVNLSTVTEAYAEATRRQLVSGEVGRGTYVRAGSLEADLFVLADDEARAPIDLSTNLPAEPGSGADLDRLLTDLAAEGALTSALAYPGAALLARARAAAQAVLTLRGIDTYRIGCHIVAGAQQALMAVLMRLVGPGGKVLVEDLTFPGIKAVARDLGITLVPVAMDGEGVLPDALAREARRSGATVAVLVPNLQNPTTATMSADRRAAVIAIAEKLGLTLIEDDVYGGLVDRPPLLQSGTDRVVHLSSLSKTAAPGLRFGWIAGAPERLQSLALEAHSTYWPMSPVALTLACRMIENGMVAERIAWQRREATIRHRLYRDILGDGTAGDMPTLHAWLPHRDGARLAREARQRGVSVVPAAAFAVGRGAPDGIRICLTAPATRGRLRDALTILAETLSAC